MCFCIQEIWMTKINLWWMTFFMALSLEILAVSLYFCIGKCLSSIFWMCVRINTVDSLKLNNFALSLTKADSPQRLETRRTLTVSVWLSGSFKGLHTWCTFTFYTIRCLRLLLLLHGNHPLHLCFSVGRPTGGLLFLTLSSFCGYYNNTCRLFITLLHSLVCAAACSFMLSICHYVTCMHRWNNDQFPCLGIETHAYFVKNVILTWSYYSFFVTLYISRTWCLFHR